VLDLIVTRQARADIIRIIDYIADRDPAAAQRVFDQLRQKIEKLTENPLIYRSGRILGTREMVAAKNYWLSILLQIRMLSSDMFFMVHRCGHQSQVDYVPRPLFAGMLILK